MTRLPYLSLLRSSNPGSQTSINPKNGESGLESILEETYKIIESGPLDEKTKRSLVDSLIDEFLSKRTGKHSAKESVRRLVDLADTKNQERCEGLKNKTLTKDDVDYITAVAQEALTCVANMALLNHAAIVWFEDIGGMPWLAKILETSCEVPNICFLCGRIIFLITHTGMYVKNYVEELNLPKLIAKSCLAMVHTAVKDKKNGVSFAAPFNAGSAINELLKAAFNLCTFYHRIQAAAFVPSRSSGSSRDSDASNSNPLEKKRLYNGDHTISVDDIHHFVELIDASLQVILLLQTPNQEPEIPATQALNVLLNAPISNPSSVKTLWIPISDKWSIADHFSGLVKAIAMPIKFNEKYKTMELEKDKQTKFMPVFLILAHWVSESEETRKYLLPKLLGNDDGDKNILPENSKSLCGQLLRIIRSPLPSEFSNAVSDLVFCLCEQDPKIMINRFGYGNVAGYFVRRHIAIDSTFLQEASGKNASKSKHGPAQPTINPFTGRPFVAEKSTSANDDLPDMTEEEKEREAERLFVLFDRLNRTGIIKVKNPIEEAYKSGKMKDMGSKNNSDDDSS
ncbi:hypothetical protein H4219_002372 [Mycoemilia scoparia]|uniref:Uncharacterized protein n=1 Tax=Mycoemilia scoparia TaxID=417184 RepID=A0A9W8DUH7_9FUNG|nr:hypothetical protein H4219_002372 [Mycoemilia scoparia]